MLLNRRSLVLKCPHKQLVLGLTNIYYGLLYLNKHVTIGYLCFRFVYLNPQAVTKCRYYQP